jgi:hypothetical protein
MPSLPGMPGTVDVPTATVVLVDVVEATRPGPTLGIDVPHAVAPSATAVNAAATRIAFLVLLFMTVSSCRLHSMCIGTLDGGLKRGGGIA